MLSNKDKGIEKLLEDKENIFLPPTLDDKPQSDYRVGINRGPVRLPSGRWRSNYYGPLIFNLILITSPSLSYASLFLLSS
jgi:hypothetical protein